MMHTGNELESIRDIGAQNERTKLAWTRTVLSLVATGLLVGREANLDEPTFGIVIALGTTSISASIVVLAWHRYRYAANRPSVVRPPISGIAALLICLAVVSTGIASGWFALTS
jgi:uncharacterized membrane protein YidH (DUF202 family)